jgi:protein-disulfide isomerase
MNLKTLMHLKTHMNLKTLGAAIAAITLAAACGQQARATLDPVQGHASMGPADAQVVVVEYGSPTCPGCKSWHDQYWEPLKTNYITPGKVRFEFRELAVHGALDAAIFAVARCAGDEDYFAVLDEVFANQAELVRAASGAGGAVPELAKLGAKFNLSAEQVETCIRDPAIIQHVYDMQAESRSRGVEATPTFFINDQMVNNPRIEAMGPRIDALLAGETPPPEAPVSHEGHDHAEGEAH